MQRVLRIVSIGVGASAVVIGLWGCAAQSQTTTRGEPSSWPTVAPEETPGATDACADSIRFSLDREIGTGRSGYLTLTNEGASACTLQGFADVAAISADGTKLTTLSHVDANNLENTPVTIAAGDSAYVWIFWDDTPETLANCGEVTEATQLEVGFQGAMSEPTRVATEPFKTCTTGRGNELIIGPIDALAQPATKGI